MPVSGGLPQPPFRMTHTRVAILFEVRHFNDHLSVPYRWKPKAMSLLCAAGFVENRDAEKPGEFWISQAGRAVLAEKRI